MSINDNNFSENNNIFQECPKASQKFKIYFHINPNLNPIKIFILTLNLTLNYKSQNVSKLPPENQITHRYQSQLSSPENKQPFSSKSNYFTKLKVNIFRMPLKELIFNYFLSLMFFNVFHVHSC